MIQEVHLIHHTHTDLGYTDLPGTTWRLHREYIGEAMRLARRYRRYPEEARFRWTLEALLPVESFLRQASAAERRSFHGLIEEGLLGLTAMPCHLTPYVRKEEWEALFERYAPLFGRHRPKVALQNDINGFPWGLMPLLNQRGVECLWMGVNLYSGGVPKKAPAFWWWKGPGKSRLLVYLSLTYCTGYFWFHAKEWRRGPVPGSTDLWYHPPRPGEIWSRSARNLREARDIFLRKQEKLLADGYPHSLLGLQFTNMWRMDNDPPFGGLPDFVRAWNDAGYTPRLRLSTAEQFISAIRKTEGDRFEEMTGDWQDWWADGIVSMPAEITALRKAQRDFARLAPGASALGVRLTPGLKESLSERARDLVVAEEHTWCGYASMARPFDPLTVGGTAQKRAAIYQCREDMLALRAEIVRRSRHYRPTSATRVVAAVNPNPEPRSDWIEISASALRSPANAARCLRTGRLYPLESVEGPEWPMGSTRRPDDYPNNVWPAAEKIKRFYVEDLSPGEIARFELVEETLSSSPKSPWHGRSGAYRWEFDPKAGFLCKLHYRGRLLLDGRSPWRLGEIVVEDPHPSTPEVRQKLTGRHADIPVTFRRTAPRLLTAEALPSPYGARYRTLWATSATHRLEQVWEFLPPGDKVILTSTIWLREAINLRAVYLAFPFRVPGAEARYDSLETSTRVGADQLPGSCGEYAVIGEGIQWTSPALTLTLESPDAPLCVFEGLTTRTGRKAFTPRRATALFMIANNHWMTNFPHLHASKVRVRHIFQVSERGEPSSPRYGGLWAFPAGGKHVGRP